MKTLIAKIDFMEISMIGLFLRLFWAGFTNAPVLFGTLGGLYVAAVAFNAARLIALYIRNKFNRQ